VAGAFTLVNRSTSHVEPSIGSPWEKSDEDPRVHAGTLMSRIFGTWERCLPGKLLWTPDGPRRTNAKPVRPAAQAGDSSAPQAAVTFGNERPSSKDRQDGFDGTRKSTENLWPTFEEN
jgi:hypothetical protein